MLSNGVIGPKNMKRSTVSRTLVLQSGMSSAPRHTDVHDHLSDYRTRVPGRFVRWSNQVRCMPARVPIPSLGYVSLHVVWAKPCLRHCQLTRSSCDKKRELQLHYCFSMACRTHWLAGSDKKALVFRSFPRLLSLQYLFPIAIVILMASQRPSSC
ncbi:hypothetical protein BKA82DRAFT_2533120 [Pisolithus tinctorius]|nr:hypothetical protein BKA82DRAFT_2533120 [Pisolithus tinctorius]